MHKLKLYLLFVLLPLLLIFTLSALKAQESPSLDITVTIAGLQNDDAATLKLLPNTDETAEAVANAGIVLPEVTVPNGDIEIQVSSIPDGVYKLIIDAPPAYFHEPVGYFFNIKDGQIVRRTDRDYALKFEISDPSVQEYVPCRYFLSLLSTNPPKLQSDDNSRVANCMSERIIDLSAPLKQPEPDHPLIRGVITGLPPEIVATIHVHTPSGWESTYGGSPNGVWEMVVTEASGVDYIITTEAEGYISQPESYAIHLSGETIYVVVNDQVTTEEAMHLDFHFVPVQ